MLYSCYDNNLGRHVAIKKLHPKLSNNPREKERLIREARITAQLQHPNTVPVYEIGQDDKGEFYYSMKKIEGQDLFRILGRVARKEPDAVTEFKLPKLLGILLHACNALAFAHAHGVIHRDIKPENILVGIYGQVYLMDWGVAKVWGMPNELTDESQGKVDGTRTSRPGTPLYMSPEQVIGNRPIDERTDIFSMGVVLYEMLALREPYRGKTIEQTFGNILNENPPPPSSVAKHQEVPPELDSVCHRAMQKNPADRYQNMSDMIRDIRQVPHES